MQNNTDDPVIDDGFITLLAIGDIVNFESGSGGISVLNFTSLVFPDPNISRPTRALLNNIWKSRIVSGILSTGDNSIIFVFASMKHLIKPHKFKLVEQIYLRIG